MTDTQEELDVLVSDITEGADISEDVPSGLFRVGAQSMYCHVAMPISTARKEDTISKIIISASPNASILNWLPFHLLRVTGRAVNC